MGSEDDYAIKLWSLSGELIGALENKQNGHFDAALAADSRFAAPLAGIFKNIASAKNSDARTTTCSWLTAALGKTIPDNVPVATPTSIRCTKKTVHVWPAVSGVISSKRGP